MKRRRPPRPVLLGAALAVATGFAARADAPPAAAPTGFVLRTFGTPSPTDPAEHAAALLVPRAYTPERPWPLLVAVHGAFSTHVENLRRALGMRGDGGAWPDPPMLVLSPLGGGELMAYDGLGEDDVLRAIDDVRRAYNVDRDRIYLTGLSMGGGGTWSIGLSHPDLFAALVPVCGVVDPRQWIDDRDRALYDLDALELGMPPGLAENALNQRVFFFHGDADRVVPVGDSRRMRDRFKALGWLGKSVRYVELPGVGHNAWDDAYRDGNVFRLLEGIRRPAFPARVWFKAASLRHARAYWTRIDRIDRAPAEIDARQRDGAFKVRVAGASGFSLLFDRAFVAPARTITVRVEDGPAGASAHASAIPSAIYNGPAGDALSFARDGGRWHPVAAPVSGEPPPVAVVGLASRSLPRQGPHAYVYGTDGPAATVAAARRLAEALADWGPGVRARFPVLADRDLTDELTARLHLILIGDGATNRVVRRLAARAPLPIAAGASDGDRSYRLLVRDAFLPGRHVLIFGARSPAAFTHLQRRFARPNSESWAPEPNLAYIQLDAAGEAEKIRRSD